MQIHHTTIPCVASYENALALWNKHEKIARSSTERPLRDNWARYKKQYAVHKRTKEGGRESISFRYHKLHCVEYFADGQIIVRGYDSRSTNTFVNNLTPNWITPHFPYSQGEAITVDGKVYRLGDRNQIWINATTREVSNTSPFTSLSIDYGRQKAALKKYDFKTFTAWVDAYFAISQTNTNIPLHHGGWGVDMLLDRASWQELVLFNRWWTNRVFDHRNFFMAVVRAIYEREGVFLETELGCLNSLGELKALNTRRMKWRGC